MPLGWGFDSFLKGPGGGGFELFFCPGVGEFVHQKTCPGVLPGGWSGLELTDTLKLNEKQIVLSVGRQFSCMLKPTFMVS